MKIRATAHHGYVSDRDHMPLVTGRILIQWNDGEPWSELLSCNYASFNKTEWELLGVLLVAGGRRVGVSVEIVDNTKSDDFLPPQEYVRKKYGTVMPVFDLERAVRESFEQFEAFDAERNT